MSNDDPTLPASFGASLNNARVFVRRSGAPRPEARYVIYWMQIHRRLFSNYALEYAVLAANSLGLPLLVLEALRCDYPWASVRFHQFLLEGMQEHLRITTERGFNYYAYAERSAGEGSGLLESLCEHAAVLISDEFPAYIIPVHNRAIARKLDIPFFTVDANGILPLSLSERAPYSAYIFRKLVQKSFRSCYGAPPEHDPLALLKNRSRLKIPTSISERFPRADNLLKGLPQSIHELPLDRTVRAIERSGTRAAALRRLDEFLKSGLGRYGAERNHPDSQVSSGLSPYLHFGRISAHEILAAVFEAQPQNWSLAKAKDNRGSKGFLNGDSNIEDFFDELVVWRETGYHFCHHTRNYDRFDSLPNWARNTLHYHARDRREHVYDLDSLAAAQTHDEIWNAAQRQLRTEGVIHNYLRMLWGKKILEWTPDPLAALETLIELNNRYSIDGRNPNSYSGVFWTLGRFDRPWQERPIFGKIRYMSSEATRRKVRLREYLSRYGDQSKFAF
ncbi:MAG: hypothetical protein H7A21_01175 [Spirochaetales bacterium]|nr:hypothetical protein [Leptospiraceae bacterium]MCP5480020.1 hypothetical protein [Spirochaetales bacterium]MCP5485639.1 hypothetical protein [Spirochaetales bacterium]